MNTIKVGSRRIPLAGLQHGDLPNDCWLDGEPAVILRRSDQSQGFVRVVNLATRLGAEWHWEAADRIMRCDRQFKS